MSSTPQHPDPFDDFDDVEDEFVTDYRPQGKPAADAFLRSGRIVHRAVL